MLQSNPIKYSNSVKLNVTSVDNRLVCILNPDTPGTGGKRTQVYGFDADGYGGQPNASMDLTQQIDNLGDGAILSCIGSNFASGGSISFEIVTDKESQSGGGSFSGEYESQQWAFKFQKEF